MNNDSSSEKEEASRLKHVVEIIIRVLIIGFLLGWCVIILAPFVSLLLWGLIIAVSVFPFFQALRKKLKGRGGFAAILITLLLLTILIVPTVLLTDSLIDGVVSLRDIYKSGQFIIPAPDERVKDWPAIAKPVADFWTLASQNLQAAVLQFKPEIQKGLGFVLSFLGSAGVGILQMLASIIIAGLLLSFSDQGVDAARSIFVKLDGVKGLYYTNLCGLTIRNTVKGILGVATAQAFLAGAGYFLAGVPAAGLWTIFSLILAIMQVGVGLVLIPAVIYVFYSGTTLTAWLFLGWAIVVMLSDNVLKPILLGRGAPVPMLVVFLGSIGGFIANGFLGLFLGPVVLSLGYTLYLDWVRAHTQQLPAEPPAAA